MEVLGYALGPTTDQGAEVYTTRAPWPLHGLVRVETEDGGWALGQIVATGAERPGLLQPEGAHTLLESLGRLGLPAGDALYRATVRLLQERPTPVRSGGRVIAPEWEDLQRHFGLTDPDRAWPIGVVRGTEAVADQVPADLRQRAPVAEPGQAPEPAPGLPVLLDPDDQHEYPHIGIFGGSGSGKSVALRVLAEAMMAARHPALILDPHQEMDFARPHPAAGPWAQSFAGRHVVATIGQDVAIDWRQLSTDQVRRLLASAFGDQDWSPNMEAAVGVLHKRGQDLQTFRDRIAVAKAAHLPEGTGGGAGALESLRQRHRDIDGLGKQVAPLETLAALERRLNYLDRLGLFSGGQDAAQWALSALRARKSAVLRGPGRTLEFVAQYALQALYRGRRAYREAVEQGLPPTGPVVPPFWVLADEAHQFAPRNPEVRSATRAILTEIAQEGRKYGVYLVLATQRPALLADTVTAQLNTKLVLRTVRSQDILAIRQETDLGPQEVARLPFLRSGDGYLCLAAQGRTVPVRVRVPATTGRVQGSPWQELDQLHQADPLPQQLLALVTEAGGVKPTGLGGLAQMASRELGREISLDEVEAALEELVAAGQLHRRDTPLGPAYDPATEAAAAAEEEVPF